MSGIKQARRERVMENEMVLLLHLLPYQPTTQSFTL
jgi:hypothetical protein